jgi:hypothetical protein
MQPEDLADLLTRPHGRVQRQSRLLIHDGQRVRPEAAQLGGGQVANGDPVDGQLRRGQ